MHSDPLRVGEEFSVNEQCEVCGVATNSIADMCARCFQLSATKRRRTRAGRPLLATGRIGVTQETKEFLQSLEYRCGDCLHDPKLAHHNRVLRALIARCVVVP